MSYVSGPDDEPDFGTADEKITSVTVNQYGEYVFEFSVTNEECGPVTTTTTVKFYDEPVA